MKKKMKILALVVAFLGSLISIPAYAADDPCIYLSKDDPNYSMICGTKSDEDATNTIKNILNTVYLYVGIIATIAIIIGAVYYITSQGDAAKIVKAKNIIIYAAIGLIITLMAFAITAFVTGAISGTNGGGGSNGS
ncbi:hypothetical protein IKQ65_00925 [Candidatus Saccharibacteria bacterium]|nr:hypothetical protein [Candidatus Saccharibacteria bacterium]MBR6961740.1 hypothetical protein [Candidatus Saccharibacteria bacterium]